jgi:predicted transcriptional regulator
MEDWEKLVLDPACYAVMEKMQEPRRKEEIISELGLEDFRATEIIGALESEDLIEMKVEEGTRKYVRTDPGENIEKLKEDLLNKAIGGNREAVKKGNYREAWNNMTANPPLGDEARIEAAQLEVAQKMKDLTSP